jgi:hypothetical protein
LASIVSGDAAARKGVSLVSLVANANTSVLQDRPRVRLHGPGDVAEHHEPPLPGPHRAPGDPHWLTAGPGGLPHGAAHVEPRAVLLRPVPPGAARRHGDHEFPHEGGELGQLRRRELREVPFAQPLGHRGDAPHGGDALVGVIAGIRIALSLAPARGQRLVEPGKLGRQLVRADRPRLFLRGAVRALGGLDDHVLLRCGHLGPPGPGRPRTEHLAKYPLERVDLVRPRHHRGERACVQLRDRRRAHHGERAGEPLAAIRPGGQSRGPQRGRQRCREGRVIRRAQPGPPVRGAPVRAVEAGQVVSHA